MVRALSLLALPLLCGGCSDGCGNTLVSRSPSPDGRHEAVLFQRDCGATTGFSTQISVLDAGSPVARGGNVFIADDDHGAARAGDWGGPWAEVAWLSSDRLRIRYADKSRVFEKRDAVKGVTITYQAVGDRALGAP
jgi:hypothetical protein